MTVCIAAICEAGKAIVLAADAMITGEDLMIEYEFGSPKIRQLTDNCAVTAAGDATMETDLLRMVRKAISELKAPSMEMIVEKTREVYHALRTRAMEDQILLPHGLESMDKFYETQKTMLEPVAKSIFNDIEDFDLELDLMIDFCRQGRRSHSSHRGPRDCINMGRTGVQCNRKRICSC